MSKNRKVIFLRKENGDVQGEFYYPDGSKYVGEWKNGKHHGKSILSFYNGNNLEGEWRDGEFIGHVTYVFPDGEYIGGWKDGEPHGNGTFINPYGSTFEGTYNDGERDGKGTVITSV